MAGSESRLFGDQALSLIVESRRSTLTNTLQKYNDPGVRSVCREMRMLDSDLERLKAPYENLEGEDVPQGVIAAAGFYHVALRRNKRCLLAYQNQRLQLIKDSYWGAAGSVAHLLGSSEVSSTGESIRSKLSPHEVDFIREYNDIVQDFRGDFADLFDVVGDVTDPPKELYVVVRVVKDCGTIQTELGAIDFQRGQRFMVRRSDIEQLITQGFLEIVGK